VLAQMGERVLAGQEEGPDGLPKRPLGNTGEKVSILCLGGWHIGAIDDKDAVALMHQAIDEGLTFFDNAWDYHDGRSEEVMGKALSTNGRRDKVFLMTKNCARDRQGSMQHLDDSLRRLKTDRIDLWQFHEINMSRKDLLQDLGVARGFQPMPQEQMQKLLAQTAAEGADGRHELFKSTQVFDGPYHRQQHGFDLEKPG
jgi:aryl-alcohol dehydrogenase-like predicted oxidoreductase